MISIKKEIPKRTYHGIKWVTTISNKKRLVDDFNHKCAYCDDSDRYCGGPLRFHVDHFAPKVKYKHLEWNYDNLLYSCPFCNGSKSDKWVGKDEYESYVNDEGFIDPCKSEYINHLHRNDDGSIIAKTKLGEYMRRELKLYLDRHRIYYMIGEVEEKWELLKKKYEAAKRNKESNIKLEMAYLKISAVLCDYYKLIHDKDQNCF